jgi:UDP-4-amino-4,6-dideoxy-N-acetyl-beta-L-altrosamine transaminase
VLPFLPYGRQTIDDADVAAVADVLRGDWLTTGPAVPAFEAAVVQRSGALHAVACSSGTAALHLSVLALELGPGDGVIVPSLTFVATANAVRLAGAEVQFADVDSDTGLLRAQDLDQALSRISSGDARAVIAVHLNGQCCELDSIAERANRAGLDIIEDGAHAFGGEVSNGDGMEPVGCCRLSKMTAFSFHPVKVIAMGEGGALTTNDGALAERLTSLRNHGIVRDPTKYVDRLRGFASSGTANPWYYEQQRLGLNYRASDIHCALGTSQLAKLDQLIEARATLVRAYDEALETLAPTVRPVARVAGGRPAWHLYPVHVDFDSAGLERAELMTRLREAGVGTQVHYEPVHMQPYYRERYGELELPGARAYAARCLSLPLFPGLTLDDVNRVVDALASALGTA